MTTLQAAPSKLLDLSTGLNRDSDAEAMESLILHMVHTETSYDTPLNAVELVAEGVVDESYSIRKRIDPQVHSYTRSPGLLKLREFLAEEPALAYKAQNDENWDWEEWTPDKVAKEVARNARKCITDTKSLDDDDDELLTDYYLEFDDPQPIRLSNVPAILWDKATQKPIKVKDAARALLSRMSAEDRDIVTKSMVYKREHNLRVVWPYAGNELIAGYSYEKGIDVYLNWGALYNIIVEKATHRANPLLAQLQAAIALLADYEAYHKEAKKDPFFKDYKRQKPLEIQHMPDFSKDGGYNNIMELLKQASEPEIEYWTKWYHHAHQYIVKLAQKYDQPLDVVASIVATLSPGLRFLQNLKAAAAILDGSDKKLGAWSENMRKAKQILESGIPSATGRKVSVFYKSLLDPASVMDHAVLDGHAINLWRGDNAPIKGLRQPSAAERAQMLSDYRRAAVDSGLSTQGVQALTWYLWKSAINNRNNPFVIPE